MIYFVVVALSFFSIFEDQTIEIKDVLSRVRFVDSTIEMFSH